MKKIGLVLLMIILITGSAAAQEPRFKLTAADTQIKQGTTTYLQLVVTNARGAEKVEIKGIDQFQSAYRGSSTKIKIVNGERTLTKEYNYALTPTAAGKFTLQGVVKYQGELHTTNRLTVTVKEGKVADQDKQPGKLFLQTNLSSEKIYFGQKAVLEYVLFSRYRVEQSGFLEQIEIDNFMVNKLEPTNQEIVRIKGQKYLKQKVGRVVLTPMETGQFKIPAYRFQVNLSTGDGFFSSTTAKRLTTEPKQIEVLPLPQQNQPDNFSGVVGNLELTGSFSDAKVEYGDSVTLAVTAQGNCNLDNLEEVVNQKLSGVEVYETEKSSQERIKNGNYQAQKKFEVILVPQQGGEIKIPDLKLAYFNPTTKKYETAAIEGTKLQVTGAPKQKTAATQVENKTVTIDQISVPKTNDENYYTLTINKAYLNWGLIGLVGLVLVAGLVLVVRYYWFASKTEVDKIYSQIKKADTEEKIYDLFNQLIKVEYGVSLKASSKSKLSNYINDQQMVANIYEIMDYMENRKYDTSQLDLNLKEKIKDIYEVIS